MVKLRNPPVFYKKRDCDRRNDRNDYQYDHQLRQSKSFFLCVFHLYSSFIRCFRHFYITFYYMMWVSKVPNYDAYGLFRALHSHNPFYAPLRSVLNMCHWHIAPLASLYDFTYISSTHSDKKSPDITVKTALSEDFPINSQNLCEITFHFSDNIQKNRSSE